MRCQVSIWRWSPRFGICLSKSSAAARWTTYGAYDVLSAVEGWDRPCQCASSVSPRHVTRPMPVIQTSRASAMGEDLHRERNFLCNLFHRATKRWVREFDETECELGVTYRLSRELDIRLGDREAGAVVHELCRNVENLSGGHERPQLRFLYGGEKGHAGELVHGNEQPPRRLRHRLDQQHAGHQRMPGEMTFKNRGCGRD